MPKKSFFQKVANMPIAVVPTMLGAATLSNMYLPLGFSWIRHITMWASAVVLIVYLLKVFGHFGVVKNEYSNTVPASLYAGITMVTMVLSNYVYDFSPAVGKAMWLTAIAVHAVHILLFTYRNVVKGVKIPTFVPSWFVTYNGIMVSTVVGGVMKEPVISKIIVYYGIAVFVVIIPFMVYRLRKHPIADPLFHTQAIVLAPSSLCVVSYLNVIENPNPLVVYALYACVLIALVFILLYLPKFFSFAFHPGFAALTFPMAIGIVATNKFAGFLGAQGLETIANVFKQIGGIQLYITTGIICFVLFNFYKILANSYKQEA